MSFTYQTSPSRPEILQSLFFAGVPSDHWDLTGLCRSSRQEAIPLLYGLLQRRYHLGQSCLYFVHSLWLVQSIFELQSLRRIERQVCEFQVLS